MSKCYEIYSLVPKRALIATFWGVIRSKDIVEFNQEITEILADFDKPMYIITDEIRIEKTILSYQAVVSNYSYSSQLDALISIGRMRRSDMFMSLVVARLFQYDYYTARNLQEAITLLRTLAPDLKL